VAPSSHCNPSVSPRKAPRNEELECQPRVVPQPQNPPERECRRHRERAALQRRVNRDRSIFCLWANWPRRSKATTPDSLWASGWGAPEPGCARSEATTAARRWREAERSDAVMFPSETPTAAPWPDRGRTVAEPRPHRGRAALQRRVNRDRSMFCLWANWPRRSKATTPDSLWASGWGTPEPGCARSEATTAARRWREAERSDAVMFPSETPTAGPRPDRGRAALQRRVNRTELTQGFSPVVRATKQNGPPKGDPS
jgi:ribosomal protein L25 (general stress protein Ctc)